MEPILRKVAVIMVLVTLMSSAVICIQPSDDDGRYEFVVATTTDMHARSTAYSVITGEPDVNTIQQAATAIRQLQSEYGESMLLLDNGDDIDGNATDVLWPSYGEGMTPMYKCFAELGYDAINIGNHEFKIDAEYRNEQIRYLKEAGVDVLTANAVLIEDGVDFYGNPIESDQPFYDPYKIFTVQLKGGMSVDVAVVNITELDPSSNPDICFPNISMTSKDNVDKKYSYEIMRWVSEIRENDLADIVVLCVHEYSTPSFKLEYMGEVSGVDLLVAGHDHIATTCYVTDADGKSVPVVNAGGTSVSKSVFSFRLDGGKVSGLSIDNSLIGITDLEYDEETTELTMYDYIRIRGAVNIPLFESDATWTEYSDKYVGRTNLDALLSNDPYSRFFARSMIYGAWEYSDVGADIALFSSSMNVSSLDRTTINLPMFSGNSNISLKDLFPVDMYYTEKLVIMEIPAEGLYAWINYVVDSLYVEDGKIKGELASYDYFLLYGVQCTFDLNMEKGHRVIEAKYKGVDLSEMETSLKVASSGYMAFNYVFRYIAGITDENIIWDASTKLVSGESTICNMMRSYGESLGVISVDDTIEYCDDTRIKVIY